METTESVVLAIVVWGIAALLLSYIAVLKIKKKISWKTASIAVIVVFTLRGTLITLLAGVFIYNIYSEYGKPVVAYLEYLFAQEEDNPSPIPPSKEEKSTQSTTQEADDNESEPNPSCHEDEEED